MDAISEIRELVNRVNELAARLEGGSMHATLAPTVEPFDVSFPCKLQARGSDIILQDDTGTFVESFPAEGFYRVTNVPRIPEGTTVECDVDVASHGSDRF